MKLPDFLVIGAMKAGTTTLYRDLLTHPRIFMPQNKEPESLCSDEVFGERGRAEYARLFARAGSDQLLAEASTAYTKLPDYPGVPERAARLLGDGLRVIYTVRDPISRLISHHHHCMSNGEMGPDIDAALRDEASLVNYSKYAMQIEPWIGALGAERVRVVRFEDYVGDRVGTISGLCRFLGLEPMPERLELDRSFNRSEGKPVLRGPLAPVFRSRFYRKVFRELIPADLKEKVRRAVLPKAPPRPEGPSRASLERVLPELEADTARLGVLLGWEAPVWDLMASVARHAGSENGERVQESAGAVGPARADAR